MLRTLAAGVVTAGLALTATTVQPHPHVWVDGGADFGVDADGRLVSLHITWIYDEFASLYMVNYLGVDQDGDGVLSEADKSVILADQTNWPDEFAGDSYLFVDGKKRALGKPEAGDTRILEGGRVEVTFQRPVLEPFRPGVDRPEAIVKVYDPTFYYEYVVLEAAKIIGPEGHGCVSEFRPVDVSDAGLAALRVELSALGRNETPDRPDVGALFANELVLRCA